jgi:ferredoxin
VQNFRYFSGVATVTMDAGACVGCGMCTQVCPHGVLVLNGRKAMIVDRDGCMECGACANNCPTGAVSVTPGVGCAAYIVQTWLKGKNMPVKTSCC